MNKQRHVTKRLIGIISSPAFFWVTVVFFSIQALWIAFTGLYPMAFDENVHLGVIKLYAQHPIPFWNAQPDGANAFGAITRDPSYLYHYLTSFPYRLVSQFTSNQSAQVLILRCLNIAMFAASLPIYRLLLLKTGASKALANTCIAVFVLIPISPLLAAQINYDNALMPITATTLLLAVMISNELKNSKSINLRQIGYLLLICLLGSLIKYAFLPIVLGVAAFLVIRLWQTFRRPRHLYKALLVSWNKLGSRLGWVLVLLILLSFGLFAERYGLNIAKYHKPVADCEQVLGIDACSEYGPWIRDYNLALNKDASSKTENPVGYADDWLYGMWMRSFFAVDGPNTQFQTRGPFIMPALTAVFLVVIGGISLVIYWRRILRLYSTESILLITGVAVFYVGVLALTQYQGYVQTGKPVAINGRYLLPVLLPVAAVAGLAVNELLRKSQAAKVVLVCGVLVFFMWGGGALTYVLRSNDAWYWHNQAVYDVNHVIQHVLGPITPGYDKPTQFLR